MHVGVGEHQPAVDEQDAAVRARSPCSCDRSRRARRGRRRAPVAASARPASRRAGQEARSARPGPSRFASTSQRARLQPVRRRRPSAGGTGPAGRPRTRSIALVGQRVRRVVAGLEGEALEQPGVDRRAPVDVALAPTASNSSLMVRRRSSAWPRRRRRRRRRPAAAGSSRRRRCTPRSSPGRRRRSPGGLGRVAGGVLQRRRCWAPRRARRTSTSAWRSCGRCGSGCRRRSPAGRWPRPRPGGGPRCRPATDGCSTGTERRIAGHAELRRLRGEVHRVRRVVRSRSRRRPGCVTASATAAHRLSFSSSVSVGASPVVPATTRPVVAVVLEPAGQRLRRRRGQSATRRRTA